MHPNPHGDPAVWRRVAIQLAPHAVRHLRTLGVKTVAAARDVVRRTERQAFTAPDGADESGRQLVQALYERVGEGGPPPSAPAECGQLRQLVETARRLQKAYFAGRKPAVLSECKDAERRLDDYLAGRSGPGTGDLFADGGAG